MAIQNRLYACKKKGVTKSWVGVSKVAFPENGRGEKPGAGGNKLAKRRKRTSRKIYTKS